MDTQWLAVFLLALGWTQLCCAQELPSTCLPSAPSRAWWKPLITNGRDPCQIHQDLKNEMIFTTCCALGVTPASQCGPCSTQTYNIVAACAFCSNLSNQTASSADTKGIMPNAFPQLLAKASTFTKGKRNDLQLPTVALWMSTPPKGDFFDAADVVQATQPPPPPPQQPNSPTPNPGGTTPGAPEPTTSSPLNVSTSSPSSTSILSSANTRSSNSSTSSHSLSPPSLASAIAASSPTPSLTQQSSIGQSSTSTIGPVSTPESASAAQPPSRNRAGAIAGGVIGSLAGLALLIGGAYYIRRRRINARIPASAKFAFFTQVHPQGDLPPPFSPGGWNSPIVEKTTATVEHGHQYSREKLDSSLL